MVMQILCLGNNTEHTDTLTRKIAADQGTTCHGLLSELDNLMEYSQPGYYHTTVVDISYGKLVSMSKEFDQVLVLDQPKESYSHADFYYKTIQLAGQLHNTIWQNVGMCQDVGFFENLVNTNSSFCIFPFIELLVNNNHTTVCCRSNTPIVEIHKLTDYQTDKNYQIIRNRMLKGIAVPEHCSSCYKVEALGMRSARQQETVEWANRLNMHSLDDLNQIQHPVYYEVRPSNVCNLQCRMCGPGSSELINQEFYRIGFIKQPIELQYSNFDIVDIEHVKKLYVAGGEPTAMPEFYEFLDRCVDSGHTFDFTINTNAVKLSDKFKKQLKQLPHLQFIVSIDGYGDLNHYIRWPSEWTTVINNVHYLHNQGHVISFNVTVSMYNVAELHQLLSFFDQEFPGVLVHCQLAVGITSPLSFPNPDIVLEDVEKIRQLACYQNDPLLSSFIEGIIKHFQNVVPADISNFVDYNTALDKSRGINLKNYAPKLWQALQGIS
jgi:uncharacterized Fe-S cluster-containing radical SAM superfamily protein